MQKHTRFALFGMLSALGIREREKRLRFVRLCGFPVDSFTKLSDEDAQFVCDVLQELGPPD